MLPNDVNGSLPAFGRLKPLAVDSNSTTTVKRTKLQVNEYINTLQNEITTTVVSAVHTKHKPITENTILTSGVSVNTSQLRLGIPNDVNSAPEAFLCLYNYSNAKELPAVAKRHHQFVIALFSKKLYSQALVHLKISHFMLSCFVDGSYDSRIRYTEPINRQLLIGIPFYNGPQNIANLVVAFHMLLFQCLLQLMSSHYKHLECNAIDIALLKLLPFCFLSDSNFSRWLDSVHPSPKHLDNLIKLCLGFMKICQLVKHDLQITQIRFHLKLQQYQYLRHNRTPTDLYHNENDLTALQEFHDDLNRTLPLILGPETVAKIISIKELVTCVNTTSHQFESMVNRGPNDSFNNKDLVSLLADQIPQNPHLGPVFVDHVINNFKQFKTITHIHFKVFDSITLTLQQRDITTFKQICFIMAKFKQIKRLRNLLNLAYNLGLDHKRLEWFKESVAIEFDIYNGELGLLKNKVVKVVGHFNEAGNFQDSYNNLMRLFHLMDANSDHCDLKGLAGLLVKCIDGNFQDTFGSMSALSSEFKSQLFKQLARLNYAKLGLIYESLQLLDLDQLRCGYYYCFYTGKDHDIGDISVGSSLSHLLMSGIVLNKAMVSWDPKELERSVDYFQTFVDMEIESPLETIEDDDEYEIFHNLMEYLKFTELYDFRPLLQKYKHIRNYPEISIYYIQVCFLHKEYHLIHEELQTIKPYWQLLSIQLLQLQLYVETNDITLAQTKFGDVRNAVDRPEFTLNDNHRLLVEKLNNLMTVAQFLLVVSRLNLALHNPVQSYKHLKVGIKLVVSVLKKIPHNQRILKYGFSSLMVQFYYFMIQLLKHVGVSKDLRFYMDELSRFNHQLVCPTINTILLFYLADTYYMVGDTESGYRHFKAGSLILEANPDETLTKVKNNSRLLTTDGHIEHFDLATSISPYSGSEIAYLTGHHRQCIAGVWKEITFLRHQVHHTLSQTDFNVGNGVIFAGTLSSRDLKSWKDPLRNVKHDIYRLLDSGKLAIHEFKDLCFRLHEIETATVFSNAPGLKRVYHLQDTSKQMSYNYERDMKTPLSTILPEPLEEPKPPVTDIDEFYKGLELIPSSWTVLTIDIDEETDVLYITRLIGGETTPTFMRLPLTRLTTPPHEKRMDFQSVMRRLNEIIRQSDESITPKVTSTILTKDDRKNWWKLRFSLDLQMADLLDDIECYWLGSFRAALHQPCHDEYHDDAVDDLIFATFGAIDTTLLDVLRSLVDAITFEHDTQTQRILIADLFAFVHGTTSYNGASHGAPTDAARDHFLAQIDSIRTANPRTALPTNPRPTEHIVLVPDSKASAIPWESLGCFRQTSVTRMPSVQMMCGLLQSNTALSSPLKLHYIINPGGDLGRTEALFAPKFTAVPGWSGCVRETPRDFLASLHGKDLFVYIGHGSCEEFMRPASGEPLPPCLLLGCSSGAVHVNGVFESNSNVRNWLCCQSPMVVANLWDVTDKDIDKFSLSVFERWNLFGDGVDSIDVSQSVVKSRQLCILKYLNGSAPVVYGLPLDITI